MDQLRPVGFYDLSGESLIGGLSLRDMITVIPHDDELSIVDYLDHGVCVAGCSGVIPDCLDHNLPIRLDMDLYTDGVWEWPAYLVYYVRKYHLRLPDEFVAHMRRNNWIVPKLSASELVERIFYP